MQTSRYHVAFAATGTLSFLAASLLVWLFITEPVALAHAASGEDVSELADAVGRALLKGLVALARYL